MTHPRAKGLIRASRGAVTQRPVAFAEYPKALFAQIAQLVEQRIENPRVGGSIPPLGTITH